MSDKIESMTETSEDDLILKGLGYEKVLHRGLGAFSNFAFGFTEVAVLASFTSLYGFGLQTGGKLNVYLNPWFFRIINFALPFLQVQPRYSGAFWWSLE